MTPDKPIRVMREYVETLRALWAGKPVTHDGEMHTLRGAKMEFDQGRDYPIYIASTGPQMLRLAGEIADGVLLSAGLTLASSRRCLDLAEAGVAANDATPRAFDALPSSIAACRRTARPPRRRSCASSRFCSATADMPTTSNRRPRYRSSGDHRRARAPRFRRRRQFAAGRGRECLRGRRHAGAMPRSPGNILRSASMSLSSRSQALPTSASSPSTSCTNCPGARKR